MSDAEARPLLVITGPTAGGKSERALELAQAIGGEILSMDSMAIYRRMDLGTAKPSLEDRALVPHHLIDLVEPNQSFDVARWCEAAAAAVRDVRGRGRQPIFVGGTPLYMMAFFKGILPSAEADPVLRQQLHLREQQTPGSLHEALMAVDQEAAARIHRNDVRRLVRALEVVQQTGQPISEQQRNFESETWLRPCRLIALSRSREELHARVRTRTIAMLKAGLVDEVRAIRDSVGFSREASLAIGYAEALMFLNRRLKDEEELRNRIRRSTHRLIRRQTTWLRHIPEVQWVAADAPLAEIRDKCGL